MSLRDQILQKWGKYGEWDASGVDRAEELARLFEANGITDLGQLNTRARTVELQPGRFEDQGRYVDVGSGDSQYSVWEPKQTWIDPVSETLNDLYYGDKRLDFLGDVNRDTTISKVGSESQGDRIGWSSAGKGAVGFHKYGSGNDFYIAPSWGSTSDMKHIRGAVSAIAAPLAAAYGLQYLAPELVGTSVTGATTGGIGGLAGWDAAMADLALSGGLTPEAFAPALSGWDAAMVDLAKAGGLTPEAFAPAAAPLGGDVVEIVGDKVIPPTTPTAPTVPPVPPPIDWSNVPNPEPDNLVPQVDANGNPLGQKPAGWERFAQWFAKNPQLGITGISTLINAFKGKGDSGPTADPNAPGSQADFTANAPTNMGRTYIAPPTGYRAGFDPEHKFFTGIGPLGTGS